MKTIEPLTPLSHKSFYGKCKMLHSAINPITELKSFDTIVAKYNHKTGQMSVNGWYSATTARHINAFLAYYGFETANKKELDNYLPHTKYVEANHYK